MKKKIDTVITRKSDQAALNARCFTFLQYNRIEIKNDIKHVNRRSVL